MEKTPAEEIDAATFNAAARMLGENGVTADTMHKGTTTAGKALAEEARQLPKFIDPPGDTFRDAISKPLPAPNWSEEAQTALKRMEEH